MSKTNGYVLIDRIGVDAVWALVADDVLRRPESGRPGNRIVVALRVPGKKRSARGIDVQVVGGVARGLQEVAGPFFGLDDVVAGPLEILLVRIPVRRLKERIADKSRDQGRGLVVVDVDLVVGAVGVLASRNVLEDRAHEGIAAGPEHRLCDLGVDAVADDRKDRVTDVRNPAVDDRKIPDRPESPGEERFYGSVHAIISICCFSF